MDQRVKQVVVEETQHIKAVGTEAVKSRAYIYPVKVHFSLRKPGLIDLLIAAGRSLLCLAQGLMETTDVEAHPNHDHRRRHHARLLRPLLPPTSCYHGFHIWACRGRIGSSVDAQ